MVTINYEAGTITTAMESETANLLPEDIPIGVLGNASGTVRLAFNPHYLLGMLTYMPDNAALSTRNNDCLIASAGRYRAVVMSYRID